MNPNQAEIPHRVAEEIASWGRVLDNSAMTAA